MFKMEERELHRDYVATDEHHQALGFFPPAKMTFSASVQKRPFFTLFIVPLVSLWLLPRNIGVALMQGYRHTISRLYGDVCRYYPTCSSYTLQSIHMRGLILGIILGSWRIIRCNPWSQGGLDKPPQVRHEWYCSTKHGFVFLNLSLEIESNSSI